MRPSKLFKIAEWVALVTFIFWFVETVTFLFVQGWHMQATHPVEILCDKIVIIGIKICFVLVVWCMLRVLKYAAAFVDYTTEYDSKEYREKDEMKP